MGGLTGMMDMAGLSRLFQRAQEGDENAARLIKNMGPGLAGDAFLKKAEPMENPGGMAFGADSFAEKLPSAHQAGPQSPQPLHETGQPMSSGVVSTKGPRDWATALSALSVGLTDVGNAFGNPRAPIQGGGYELSKQRLAEQQIQQLKSRQDLWNRTHEQSQAIPPEILTDPAFASLAEKKAALDQDLLDGKIDNEKNVSGFLTELQRFAPQIKEFTMTQGVQDKAKEASLMGQEEEKLDSATRVRLEAAAAQGDLSAKAKLLKLKAEELIPGKVGGMDLTLPASKWADVKENQARDAATEAWRDKQYQIDLQQLKLSQARAGGGAAGEERNRDQLRAGIAGVIEDSEKRFLAAGEEPLAARSHAIRINVQDLITSANSLGYDVQEDPEQVDTIWINGRMIQGPAEVADALDQLSRRVTAGVPPQRRDLPGLNSPDMRTEPYPQAPPSGLLPPPKAYPPVLYEK